MYLNKLALITDENKKIRVGQISIAVCATLFLSIFTNMTNDWNRFLEYNSIPKLEFNPSIVLPYDDHKVKFSEIKNITQSSISLLMVFLVQMTMTTNFEEIPKGFNEILYDKHMK